MTTNLSDWLTSHAGLALLVFSRTLGLAWTAPALSTSGLELRYRVVMAALLAGVLVPAIGGDASFELGLTECLAEAIVGAGIGWSAALVVAGARQAGDLVGAQGGFSAAALLDPEAGDDLTALGHLYGLIALGIFLALDGPLMLVRALVDSYRVIPPGGAVLTEETAQLAFGRVGEALVLALHAAAPAAVALALAGVALGLLGRAAPSLQLMSLAMPVRSALGLIMVLVSIITLVSTLTSAWSAWPSFSVVGG